MVRSLDLVCSNCAKRMTLKKPVVSDAERLYAAGYRAVGDAMYCPECVKTWAVRNGAAFDSRWCEPRAMWLLWCDRNFR